jgi:hypothetical protein
MNSCPPFWAEKPSVLFEQANDFFPFHAGARRCTTTALNSFTRFGILLGIVLALMVRSTAYLWLGVGIAIVAAAAYYGMVQNGSVREEQFENAAPSSAVAVKALPAFPDNKLVVGTEAADEYLEDVIGSKERTEPTAANPFMNVLLAEVGDDPTRPPAQNAEFLKRQFSTEFKDRVYGDPGDVFQKNQSQRIWAVQPNTNIPNDQESFQNWLFRTPGRTCKEGNAGACKPATDGGNLTWLNQA